MTPSAAQTAALSAHLLFLAEQSEFNSEKYHHAVQTQYGSVCANAEGEGGVGGLSLAKKKASTSTNMHGMAKIHVKVYVIKHGKR